MKAIFRITLAAALVGLFGLSTVHAAGGIGNAYRNTLIDAFRGQEFAVPTAFHVALYTSACTSGEPTTEATGTNYARVQYNPTLANWAGTQGYGTTTASSGSSGLTSNNNAITFPQAGAGGWGTIQCFGVLSAPSGGTLYFYAPLTASRTITDGSTAAFAGASGANGALTFQFSNN